MLEYVRGCYYSLIIKKRLWMVLNGFFFFLIKKEDKSRNNNIIFNNRYFESYNCELLWCIDIKLYICVC